MIVWQTAVLWLAMACAAVAGFCAWKAYESWSRRAQHNRKLRSEAGIGPDGGEPSSSSGHVAHANGKSVDDIVIGLIEDETRKISLKKGARLVPEHLVRQKWLDKHIVESGLAGKVTAEGFCEARVRLAIFGGALGALVGCLFSTGFCVVLAVVGVYFGWNMPAQAIKHRIAWRSQEMERHLPEMLDVVAIGMRSGLSFDRSLQIYCQRFKTMLAAEMQLAERKWASGLERRDEALRGLAASYDSPIFSRVMESCIRSLRFGSSMVEGLESAAREARVTYRAHRQEQVAKAPVKMMVPTGVLILPAMLIMVLGPVLLELMNGGL